MARRIIDSKEGKRMRCRRGGLASDRVRKAMGYPNARAASETYRRRREAKAAAAKRVKLGLPPAARSGFTAGNGPD